MSPTLLLGLALLASPITPPAGDRLVTASGGATPLDPVVHVRTAGNRIRASPDLAATLEAAGGETPAAP